MLRKASQWRRRWRSVRGVGWLLERPERWLAAGLALLGVIVLALVMSSRLSLYGGDTAGAHNRLYLLSAIAQALAAILALLVSLTLVATQLAAQSYSPRVVGPRLRDAWLWGAVALYLAAILWALFSHGRLVLLGSRNTDVALLLAGLALLYLVPFTMATLHSLSPEMMASSFAGAGRYEALDDMIRKAAQDDQISTIEDALEALRKVGWTMVQRRRTDGALDVGERILSAGMFLTKRGDLEGYKCAADKLTRLARDSRQAGRALEADIFEGQRRRLADEWQGGLS